MTGRVTTTGDGARIAPAIPSPRRGGRLAIGSALVAILVLSACSSDEPPAAGDPAPESASADAGDAVFSDSDLDGNVITVPGSDSDDSISSVEDDVVTTDPDSRVEVEGDAGALDEPESDAPTEPVDPPAGEGDADEAVEVVPVEELDPVELATEVAAADDVTLSILDVEIVEVEALLPGEVAGPAAVVRVSVTNDSNSDVDLASVTIGLTDAEGDVAAPLIAEPTDPFDGVVAPGESATARYAFSFDGRPEPVTIEASIAADQPLIRFVGSIS